jgi:hypothetical protein
MDLTEYLITEIADIKKRIDALEEEHLFRRALYKVLFSASIVLAAFLGWFLNHAQNALKSLEVLIS